MGDAGNAQSRVMAKSEQSIERKVAWSSALAGALNRVVSATYRPAFSAEAYAVTRSNGGDAEHRALYAVHHGDLWMLIRYLAGQGVTVMVSEHRDGEIITRTLLRAGFRAVRGSSTRGGARALLEFVREAKRSDGDMAITVDGPRGPARVVKPGIVLAASRSGLPIVPLTASALSAWHAKSWDRLTIGKPFSRVAFGIGDPIEVPAEVPREEMDAWCRRVEAALEATRAQAEAKAWGVTPTTG